MPARPFGTGTYSHYMAALGAWARQHDLMTGDAYPQIDYERLAPLGVTRIKSLERARMSGWKRTTVATHP